MPDGGWVRAARTRSPAPSASARRLTGSAPAVREAAADYLDGAPRRSLKRNRHERGDRTSASPRKGASAPTDADDRFDDSRHPRRTLASNGKQASVIGAGIRDSRRAWRTRAFCECARQHAGAGWTLAALASAHGHQRDRRRAALLVLCGKQPRPGRYRFRRNASTRPTTARSLLLVQTSSRRPTARPALGGFRSASSEQARERRSTRLLRWTNRATLGEAVVPSLPIEERSSAWRLNYTALSLARGATVACAGSGPPL